MRPFEGQGGADEWQAPEEPPYWGAAEEILCKGWSERQEVMMRIWADVLSTKPLP